MFMSAVENLRREVMTLRAVRATHDHIRSIIYDAAGTQAQSETAPEDILGPVRANPPPLLTWRIYDHCAAFTRLYALYEQCIQDMVGEWLKVLPLLYPSYGDLPVAVRTGHRVGISEILQRLGGDRYGHLSEDQTLAGISDGVRGKMPYSLLVDAFLTDEQNLRRETLTKILSRVGVEDPWGWIANHGDMQRFLLEVRGGENTAEGELRDFVFFRNGAAHGVVDQVVSSEEISNIADFVLILCDVVAQLFAHRVVTRRLQIGTAEIIGRVIRQFSDRVVGVEMRADRIRVGESIVVLREQTCFETEIESIQVNHAPFEDLVTGAGDKVGLCLTRTAKVESNVIRLTEEKIYNYQI